MASVTRLERRLVAAAVRGLIQRDLRRAFRRIAWAGGEPEIRRDRALVIYSNHHNFYDGYLGWYLSRQIFRRDVLIWMEQWDAYPLFAPIGAVPFPPDDPVRRGATVRRTVRRLSADPGTALLYFPEGVLHPAEDGLAEFPPGGFERLGRLLGERVTWIPLGLYVTWWGESRPTVVAAAGVPHERADGWERVRLEQVLAQLREMRFDEVRPVLEGRRSPQEMWNLSAFRGFFSRYL